MVGDYIQPSKTIILAIMPARTDIEADIALDLIKEYDLSKIPNIKFEQSISLVARVLENIIEKSFLNRSTKFPFFLIGVFFPHA